MANPPTLDVAMLGASGTGKTSLIASMYSDFLSGVYDTGLILEPQDETTAFWLHERRAELELIAREIRVREQGIPNSSESRDLVLALRRTVGGGERESLRLRFTDYPGGWLFGDPRQRRSKGGSHQEELEQRMSDSQVLLIAVDTPGLMWDGGRHHHYLNSPLIVMQRIQQWLDGGDRSTVIFVPLKCEKWVRASAEEDQAKSIEALSERTREGYKEALEVLSKHDATRVLFSPVQTVGGLDHIGFATTPDGVPESVFGAFSAQARYEPRWTAEPLRAVVHDVITRRLEQRKFIEAFIDWVTSRDEPLKKALLKLSADVGPTTIVWQTGSPGRQR